MLVRELGLGTLAIDDKRKIQESLSRAFLFRDPEELRAARGAAVVGTGPYRVPSDGPARPGASARPFD